MPRKSKDYPASDTAAPDTVAEPEQSADTPIEEAPPKATKAQKAPKEPKANAEAERLQQECDALNDRLLRLGAEFDNFKKRTERERLQIGEFTKAATLKALVPVLDNIDLAMSADPESGDYIKGVEMMIKQLRDALLNQGLQEIEALNAPFDPNLHEAVMHEENPDLPENTVTLVLQKGYRLGDQVLRTAMVKVVN